MENIVQPILAQLAIALSVFSLITYLWLGLTVLLLGNRRSAVTWLGGMGLLLAALFFLCHGALVGAGLPTGASPTDFWWRLSWFPGYAAPFFWATIGLHYAGLTRPWGWLRRSALVAVATLGAVAALLAVVNWPVIGHYGDFIRLLGDSIRLRGVTQQLPVNASPALPALGLAFVTYMAACACLPWALIVARRLKPTHLSTEPHETDALLLWDAADAWSRARPALLVASVCMMGAGAVAALIGILSSLGEHAALLRNVSSGFTLGVPSSPPGHVALALVAADLAVQVALAGLGLAIGWAVVRQGILVERRLPQRGFLSRWRGTVFVAAILAAVVASMVSLQSEALPDLLVLVTLVTAAYALFTWQSYGEHDRALSQLRPFITSLSIGHAGWLATDPGTVERSVEALFTSLCRDVLGASRGRLALAAGRLHRSFTYRDLAAHLTEDGREWVLPVSDERGVVAQLVLGPRSDGAGYTSADLEVARACGQRILDAVSEFIAAQAIASLARRRGLEAELSAALPRRVLHDDVLPRLHLAMLRLEALRGRVVAPIAAGGMSNTIGSQSNALATDEELETVVHELGQAHHDLAALMRTAPAANPRRLEHGLVGALRSSLDSEFRGVFDALEWDAPPDACDAADALPPIVADLLLSAVLEAVRNAGRHARGNDLHRRLTLHVTLMAESEFVGVSVADDGVGLQHDALRDAHELPAATMEDSMPLAAAPLPDNGGTRSGLLTHGALIGLVGGTLSVKSRQGAGATVHVRVPRVG